MSKVYIGQTGLSIDTTIKEQYQPISLYQLDKWAVAEHSIMISGHTKRIIGEAIGIKLRPDNIKAEGSSPSMSVKHPLQAFKRTKCDLSLFISTIRESVLVTAPPHCSCETNS
jgi:hypothetical protein